MKKWEKPKIQNLALNHTQQDGVNPLAIFVAYKCTNCNQTFNDEGQSFLGPGILDIAFILHFKKDMSNMSEWRCTSCWKSGTIVSTNSIS